MGRARLCSLCKSPMMWVKEQLKYYYCGALSELVVKFPRITLARGAAQRYQVSFEIVLFFLTLKPPA